MSSKFLLIIIGFLALTGIIILGSKFASKFSQPEYILKLSEQFQEEPEDSQEETYKEFLSPDGKLKLSYPESWLSISPGLLGASWQINIGEYDLEYLLLAQGVAEPFAQLILSKISWQGNKTFKEIIDDMKKINLKKGLNMETIDRLEEGNILTFEAQYQVAGSPSLHSREKMILINKNSAFLISIFSLEKDWLSFKDRAESIINSAEVQG